MGRVLFTFYVANIYSCSVIVGAVEDYTKSGLRGLQGFLTPFFFIFVYCCCTLHIPHVTQNQCLPYLVATVLLTVPM